MVAVILDSPVGLHQGGQVSAPVFPPCPQQVLEYLHVPHDLPLAPERQLLLAQAKIKDKDLDDDTPDHPGEPLETAEVNTGMLDARETVECGEGALDPLGWATVAVWCKRQCGNHCLRLPPRFRPIEALPSIVPSCRPAERSFWTWSKVGSKCPRSSARLFAARLRLPRMSVYNLTR